MKFDDTDKTILTSYKSVAKGIASFFGLHCEVVIHALENLEHAVIHIENGHVSGRTVGAPITNYALQLMSSNAKDSSDNSFYRPYDTLMPNGKKVKSLTSPIFNGERLIGLICINLSLEVDFVDFVKPFLPANDSRSEYFSVSIDDMMKNSLDPIAAKIIADHSIPNHEKNKSIIISLNEIGFFHLKGSAEAVSEKLQISVHTVYSHLRKMSSPNLTDNNPPSKI